MKLIVLASSSKANCAVLQIEGRYILVDAGLSCAQTLMRLHQAGIKPSYLSAILLTHEHADHACGVEKLASSLGLPVYANTLTAQALSQKMKSRIDWRIFGRDVFLMSSVPNATLEPFPVNHDAADPVGFVITSPEGSMGFATDLGEVNAAMLNACWSVTTLFIEANYDEGLLGADRVRPYSVRTRISSPNGHLSNQQAADACSELPSLRKVILGHLSNSTNAPEIAKASISWAYAYDGREAPTIECAYVPEEKRCDPPPIIEII